MKKYTGELRRMMEFDSEQLYEVGQKANLGIHWATPDASSQDFLTGKKHTYNFHCENAEGMEIEYDNISEEEAREFETDADAWEECEVIVDEKQKFEILSIECEYWEEFGGYMYEVEVKSVA